MAFVKLYYVPVILVLLLNGMVVTTFTLSWISKHVTYLVPYISDTGTYPPESCIFAQALNTISLLLLVVIYVRYRQIREVVSRYNVDEDLEIINLIAKWLGYSAAFGCSLVANFQETNILIVHWIGAILTFGVGSTYMIIESIVSGKIYPICGSRTRNFMKFGISLVALITSFIFIVGAYISISNFKGEDMTKWRKEDGYLEIHICSAVCEWISAACTSLYIFLLSYDFRDISMSEPIITYSGKLMLSHRKQVDVKY